MCLAYPMKVVKLQKDCAVAEAEGIKRTISTELVENLKKGDFVMVHAGFAIGKYDVKKAKEIIKSFKKLSQLEDEHLRKIKRYAKKNKSQSK